MAGPIEQALQSIRQRRDRRRSEWNQGFGGDTPGMRNYINPLDSQSLSDRAQGVDIDEVLPPTQLLSARVPQAQRGSAEASVGDEGGGPVVQQAGFRFLRRGSDQPSQPQTVCENGQCRVVQAGGPVEVSQQPQGSLLMQPTQADAASVAINTVDNSLSAWEEQNAELRESNPYAYWMLKGAWAEKRYLQLAGSSNPTERNMAPVYAKMALEAPKAGAYYQAAKQAREQEEYNARESAPLRRAVAAKARQDIANSRTASEMSRVKAANDADNTEVERMKAEALKDKSAAEAEGIRTASRVSSMVLPTESNKEISAFLKDRSTFPNPTARAVALSDRFMEARRKAQVDLAKSAVQTGTLTAEGAKLLSDIQKSMESDPDGSKMLGYFTQAAHAHDWADDVASVRTFRSQVPGTGGGIDQMSRISFRQGVAALGTVLNREPKEDDIFSGFHRPLRERVEQDLAPNGDVTKLTVEQRKLASNIALGTIQLYMDDMRSAMNVRQPAATQQAPQQPAPQQAPQQPPQQRPAQASPRQMYQFPVGTPANR